MSIVRSVKEVLMRLKKNISLLLLIVFMTVAFVPTPVSAEYVYNADLGKFIKTDTEIYDTADEQFEHARELEEQGDLNKAEDAYSYVYRKFPDSPLAQNAIMALGEVQEKMKKYNKAAASYQQIIELYPQSPYTDEVLERQYKIGNLFLSGVRGKILNLAILPSVPQAIKVFTQVTENGAFSEYGRKAQFQLGLAHKKKGAMKEAIAAFQKYIDNYPTAALVSEAYFQIAEISYRRSIRRNNDRKLFQEATQNLRDFLRRYPDTADTERINEMLLNLANRDAQSIYDIAMYYEQASYLDSAIVYYKDVVKQYPNTQWAEKARKRLKTFEDPEKFLAEGQAMLEERLARLQQEKAEVDSAEGDSPVIDDRARALEEQIDEAKDDIKRLEKEKKNEVRIRWESYRRKKWELAEKKKKLKEKEKTLRKRPSEDLEAAITRWRDSLEAEEYALRREEHELLLLEKKLGIKNFFGLRSLFRRSTLGFGSVTDYKAKRIAQINDELDECDKRKRERLSTVADYDTKIANRIAEQKALYTEVDTASVKEDVVALEAEREKLSHVQAELDELKACLKATKGFGAYFISIPRALWKPFQRSPRKDLRTRINDLTLDVRALKDDIAHEKDRIERLEQLKVSFESALEETAEMSAKDTPQNAATQERIEKRLARKEVMGLEKKINTAKKTIDDGLKKRNELIAELKETVADIEKEQDSFGLRFLKGVAAPFVCLYKGLHTFIFGFKDIETRLNETTDAIDVKAATSRSRDEYEQIKTRIKALETEIKQAEKDRRGYEHALEALMSDLTGRRYGRSGKATSEKTSSVAIQAEIDERRAYIATQEKEVTDMESTLLQLEQEFQRAQENTQPSVASETEKDAVLDTRALERRMSILEADVAAHKKIVHGLEEVVSEKRRGSLVKASQKAIAAREAKIQKQIEEFAEEKEEEIDAILSIIAEEKELLGEYEQIIQNKLERIKKHISVMDQYQDRALADMKEAQKQTYKELDQVKSYMKRIEQQQHALKEGTAIN